jgi:hypothetical protein
MGALQEDVFRERNRTFQPSFDIIATRVQPFSEELNPSHDFYSVTNGAGLYGGHAVADHARC